jgi:hypothetical protein
MNRTIHTFYISALAMVVILVFLALAFFGADYYMTALPDRHSHELYDLLKPTGLAGHGFGVAGSFLMITGVFGYMARKRFRILSRVGVLKYWLEFHIFLCTLGPVLILFHTTFKFGGIVAISFWSMAAVMASGVIGRFIYLQIPRTIEGRELTMSELKKLQIDLLNELQVNYSLDNQMLSRIDGLFLPLKPENKSNVPAAIIKDYFEGKRQVRKIKTELKHHQLSKDTYKKIIRMIRSRIVLNRRIAWLSSMQDLFRYWHVAHLPFALIMLVIMIVHIVVALVFGYNWIL